MTLLRLLLKAFSYLFHIVLALFFVAISGLALSSGTEKLNFKMLPWTGETLTFVLFFGSLIGLMTLILAWSGKTSVLFFLWTLVVAVLAIKGYIFSGYYFAPGEFRTAMMLLAGALLSVAGAWPDRKRPRY